MSANDKYRIRELLSAPYYIAKNIKYKEQQIAMLRALAERSTPSYKAAMTSGTQDRSRIESCVVKICALADEIEKDKEALTERAAAVLALIKQVPDDRQRAVLEAYHVNRLKIWQIAQELHMSEKTVKRDLQKGRTWIEKNCEIPKR